MSRKGKADEATYVGGYDVEKPKDKQREYSRWEMSAEHIAIAMMGAITILLLIIGKRIVEISADYLSSSGSSLQILADKFVYGIGVFVVVWTIGMAVNKYVLHWNLHQEL